MFLANTSQYAHYVFNTLDHDHSGILSFEVSFFAFHLSYTVPFKILIIDCI